MTPLDSWVRWRPLGAEQANAILASLGGEVRLFANGSVAVGARCAILPFYKRHLLIELASGDGQELAFVLYGGDRPLLLTGVSDPIHETNEAESLVLTDATVGDYVRFFFFFVRSDSGAFVLVESPDEIDVDPVAVSEAQDAEERSKQVRERVAPLTIGSREAGGWTVGCTVAYAGAAFGASLEVQPGGDVQMVDDDPITELEGLSVPEYPSLAALSDAPSNGAAAEITTADARVESDGDGGHPGGGEGGVRVFICYRREDIRETARRLAESLRDRFGEESVFFDLDSLPGAHLWADLVAESIRRSDALLVVIGDRWLELLREHDGRKDQVRIEIETALDAKVMVIPVPMYGAPLPREEELPESIAAMLTMQQLRIDERHYPDDVAAAADEIERQAGIRRWGRDGRPAGAARKPPQDRERLARAAMILLQEGFTLIEPDGGDAALKRAVDVFKEVIDRLGEVRDPSVREQVAKAGRYRADVLNRLGRSEEAINAYDEQVFRFAAEPDPKMREHVGRALVNKGYLFAAMPKKQHDAIAAFNQAIARCANGSDPGMDELTAEALFHKALALAELQLYDDELEVYDELLSRFRDTTEPTIRQYVASALVEQGRTLVPKDRREEGLAAFEEVISRFAGAPQPGVREQVARAIELIQALQ